MLDLMDEYYTNPLLTPSTSCSSEEDFWSSKNACVGRFYPGRRSEAIVCHPWNSLMAVMVQMIALRVSYAWVVQQDYTLVGIVTFSEILKQFRSMADMGSNNKMEPPPPPPLENINFESDEESPLTLSQSAAPAKQSFQLETATDIPKSKLFRKLHSTAFHSVYIVLFNAKINVLLPFGPLAVLLH
ncbi:hypothetical protein Tco_1092370 [Tanacetum coccineum]|uniref:CBS domain-containing protein n=1 Tax=Tanacetum coccineum TaxID=301880 RepID=A0ABQ5IBM4_9ASTR